MGSIRQFLLNFSLNEEQSTTRKRLNALLSVKISVTKRSHGQCHQAQNLSHGEIFLRFLKRNRNQRIRKNICFDKFEIHKVVKFYDKLYHPLPKHVHMLMRFVVEYTPIIYRSWFIMMRVKFRNVKSHIKINTTKVYRPDMRMVNICDHQSVIIQ